MFELILYLIPLALIAALQPPQLVALVVLMQTERGSANGWSYFGGMVLFRLALGGVFWISVTSVEASIEGAGGRFEIFVGAILVVLGLLLLVYSLRETLSTDSTATASWLQRLNAATPSQAALAGVAFLALDPRDWLIAVSAIDLIAAADLTGRQSLAAFITYILLTQLLLLIPLLMALIDPQGTAARLAQLRLWLDRHERLITLAVGILLGLFFIYSGLDYLSFWS